MLQPVLNKGNELPWLQTRRKYLQKTHLIKHYYPTYMENPLKSTIRKQASHIIKRWVKNLNRHHNCTLWYLSKGVEHICPHKHLHMIFIAAIHIIAKTWEQSVCPSVGEWVNKLCYIQTMEYYTVFKRNELSSHEKTWRRLKCLLLHERSQAEKTTYCMIQLCDILKKRKTMETIKRSVVARV